jgi:phosphoribosylanthranilate isomerase
LLDGFDRRRHGGSGKTFRWNIALRAKRTGHIFLAGGLTPKNATEAIRSSKPYAVDVCSGVEAKPGKKDPALVANFMRAVRTAQRKVR